MRRRFAQAERVCIAETPLARPALRPDAVRLRAHFASEVGRAARALRNPHVEPPVDEQARARARPAAVLIPVMLHEEEPTVVLTRRPMTLSSPGHWVFPGGRRDAGDESPIDTALREAHEEIGLARERVEVLGRLGDYVSHSGFRITPVVGLVEPPAVFVAQAGEVDAIVEVPFARLFDPHAWFVYGFPGREGRRHFTLDTGREEAWLTGVTASLAVNLYSELLASETPSS